MIRIGIDYYPEQWDRTLWEEDVIRMKALGAHVISPLTWAFGATAAWSAPPFGGTPDGPRFLPGK